MAGPRSVKEIREANGGLDHLTDFDIAQHEFGRFNDVYQSFDSFAKDVGFETGGKWGNRLSASVDNWQAGLQGVAEAVGGSMGLGGTERIFGDLRRANEMEAQNARQLARSQGAITSFKEADSFSDYADLAGGLVVDSLPSLGEALVGGIAGRALLSGARLGLGRATAGSAGATAASYPSAVGDILQNQRDENGTTDLGSAALGGVPYALANGLFGIEGAIGRGSLARSGFAALDGLKDFGGAAARTAATAGRVGLSEGFSETSQELFNQSFGRMAVNPDETLFNPEANDRYMESFLGGALLGGLTGGAAGGWRRSEGYVDDSSKPTDLLGGNYNLTTDMGALPPLQDRINQNLGLNLKGAPKDYDKIFDTAYNEPSGERLPDPQTGVERELSMGELREMDAEHYQEKIRRQFYTPATGTEISSLLGSAVDPLAGNLGGTLYNPQGGLTPAPAAPNLTPEQQAAVQAAQEVEASAEAERAEAARFGITKDSQVRLLADVKDTLGDSDPVEYGRLAGLIKAGRYGDVKQELKNAAAVAEQKKITQEANAAETESLTKAVQSNAAPQPPGLQIDLGADTGVPLEAGAIDAQTQDSVGRDQLAFNRWQELATEAARYNLPLPIEWGDLREDQKALVAEIAATKEALTFADVDRVRNLPEPPAKATGLKPPAAAPVANQDLEAAPTEQATTGVGQPGSSVKQQAVAEEQTTTDTASQPALGLQRKATAPTTPFVPAVEEQAAAPAATVEPTAPATEDQPATPAADTSPAAPEPAVQPAPAVGLQRQATAPTTPFVPAVEEQAAAPAVGTSPAADAWQQAVAQAQSLGLPVPTYGELRVDQQKQVEDLVRREQFNLAAANTILAAPETKKPQPSAAGVNARLPEKQGVNSVQANTSADTASLGRPGGGQAAVQGDGAVPGQVGAGGGIQRASSGGEQARGEGSVASGVAVDGRGLKSQVRVRGEGEPARTSGGYEPRVEPAAQPVLGAESKSRPDVAPPADGKAVLEPLHPVGTPERVVTQPAPQADVKTQWNTLTKRYKKLPAFDSLTKQQVAKAQEITQSSGKALDVSTALQIAGTRVSKADAKASAKEKVVGGIKVVELPYVDPSKSSAAKVETQQGAAFRRNFLSYYQKMEPVMQQVWRDWVGFDVDSLGEPILMDDGESLSVIGAGLENSKSGGTGMTKQGVHKRVKKQLQELGLDDLDVNEARERIILSLAGTDAETIDRNSMMVEQDAATKLDAFSDDVAFEDQGAALAAMVADEIGAGKKATSKKAAPKKEPVDTGPINSTGMYEAREEAGNELKAAAEDDTADNSADEDSYEVDFDAAQAKESEAGTLRDFLQDDIERGEVVGSDIEEAQYLYDTLLRRGPGAFAKSSVGDQADLVRKYARQRNANPNDTTIKQIKGVLDGKRKSESGTQSTAGDQEAVRGRAETPARPAVEGQPAGNDAGLRRKPGQTAPEVQQAGNQAAAPAVVAKKRRRLATPEAGTTAPAAEIVQTSAPAAEPTKTVETANPIKASMYHGSPNGGLTELRGLTFLTNDVNVATQYAKGQVFNTGGTEDTGGKVYRVAVSTKNTLDLRKPEHQTAYETARRIWNKAADVDDRLPPITSEGFVISKTGLPSYGRIATVLNAMPEFDSAFVDEGTQGVSLAVLNDAATPAAEIVQAPDTDTAKAVEQAPATPAEPALLNQYNPDEGPSARRADERVETRNASRGQPGQNDLFYPNGEPTYGADASEPTPEVPEWAATHARDLSGDVVYFDRETALVAGYSALTGQVIYSAVLRSSGSRTRVDIRSYAGGGFTTAQKSNLAAQADRLDAESSAMQEQYPDGPFAAGDNVAATEGVASELADYTRGLLSTLNMSGVRVFLLYPDDVRGNREKYKLFGSFGAAGSAGMDANEDGSMRKFGGQTSDFYIALRPGMPITQSLETLAHEVGHIVECVAFDKADIPTKNEIIREFNAWFTANKDKDLRGVIPELRNRETAAAHLEGLAPGIKPSFYWLSFSEWFADNVSRWATTADKPLSLVDKFFKSVAEQMRKLVAAVTGKKYAPNPVVAKFLDEMVSGKFGAAPINNEAKADPTNLDIRYSRGARKAPDGGFGAAERGTAPGETKVGYIHTTTDKQAFTDAYPGAAAAVRGLEGLGLRHIWDRVASIHVTDDATLGGNGALVQAEDGSIQLWLDRDFLVAQDPLRELINHELGGHLVDGGYGAATKGKFSGGIKWQVQVKNGKVTPVGAVARELYRLAETREAWKSILAYPLVKNKGMDANRVAEELFAQAAMMYISNPEVFALRAPLTAAALQEAFKREAITKSESIAKHKPRPAARPEGSDVSKNPVGGDPGGVGGVGQRGGGNTRRNQKGASKTDYLKLAPSELADLASGVTNLVKDWTFTRGAFTRDLLEAATKLMPSASKYLDRMQRARVESVKLEREVAAILDDAAALSATERGTGEGSVNALIRDMTYDGKWAFTPDWLKGVTPDPVLEARFNQMSKEARDVVTRVFRHGYDTLKNVQQAATDSIKAEVDPLIAQARAEGDMKTVKELERAKVKADGKFRRLVEIRGGMPYAPLRRFGNWAVVVKSKMFQDAEADGDQDVLDKLRADGNHYRVEFVSNRLVAAGRANRLREVVGDSSVEFFERSDDALLYGGNSMFSAFTRFRKLAREKMEGEESKVAKALDVSLASMYMALVAETSARTSEFDRKNVAGADKDMLRSFATHGRAMAGFIGSLKTSGDVMDTLRIMKREAREGGNRAEKSTLYNEILRRHAMGLTYEPNQLLDKSLAANSYWSLITSPSYLLTNLTQPWVVSLPVLAGRFGMGRSSSEMFRAYKEIGRVASRLVDNQDAVKNLPKDVQGAVEELFNRGSIDISLGADLGSFTSGGSSKLSANMEKAIRFPRTLVERGEMVNRVATAVAAYRLAKSQRLSDEAAINYADKVIYETHGDYSAFNSPRMMRTSVGRFATQFRKFQLIQISMYARMIRDSFKDLPKGATEKEVKEAQEARYVARKALAYTLGTTFALGGVTALPGFAAISFLLGAFGDDDEPDDPEATMRRALGGGAKADFLMRGVPNLLGMNLGNRIGAGGMLSILPYTDLEASREGYKDIMLGVAGPFFGGTLPKALDGLGLIRQGDLWKGLEMLAPRGVADLSKGWRFAAEGVTKRNGDTVLSGDEVSFFAAAAQAMGLPTTTITDNQMLRNSQFTADEFYKERTGQLKRQYVQAYRSGDGAKLQEIRAEWQDTQQARRRLGFKVQPLSTLLKSPQEQRKREAKPLNTELVE